MIFGVLCAVRGAGETALVTALDGAAGRVTVERRCADVAELLAAAAAGVGRIAVVSADLPRLDREAVAQLHAARVRVLALTHPAGGQVERMLALGVDAVVDDATAAVGLVAAVLALGEAADEDLLAGAGPEATDRAPGELGAADPDAAAPTGRMIAVWGPTGAPGRSTLALNLAAELAGSVGVPGPGTSPSGGPRGALIIDADTYGGTIAQLAGLLDESPGLAAAARAAGQGTLDLAALARLTPVLSPGLRVLTGISRANRWPELPASALEVVWEIARSLAAWTVVDCGFCLEQDEALSYDTHAPRRNAATLSALEAADVVVVVGSGDPVGIQRLVRGLTDLASLPVPVTARRVVVVNRVRSSAAGPRPGDAIGASLGRFAGVDAPHLVPDDRGGVDAATLRGVTLRESSSGSPARRAIAAIAAGLEQPARAAALAARLTRQTGRVRIYLPATLLDLVPTDAGARPDLAPRRAHAVTRALRELFPDADEEGLEFAASLAAADDSLELLGATPGAPRRRLVLTADVADTAVHTRTDGDDVPSAVEVTAVVTWDQIACGHVDEPGAADDVLAALTGADAAVEQLDERDLLWYDVSELDAIGS